MGCGEQLYLTVGALQQSYTPESEVSQWGSTQVQWGDNSSEKAVLHAVTSLMSMSRECLAGRPRAILEVPIHLCRGPKDAYCPKANGLQGSLEVYRGMFGHVHALRLVTRVKVVQGRSILARSG